MRTLKSHSRALYIMCVLVASAGVAACSGGESTPDGPNTGAGAAAPFDPSTLTWSKEIGETGGIVEGPRGTRAEIPPGALREPVTISISVVETGFSALPATAQGDVFAFEPHGLSFDLPVTLTLPHSGQPEELAVYTSDPEADWSVLRGAVDYGAQAVTVQVEHFSFFFNGREVCGLAYQDCCAGDLCAGNQLRCVDQVCAPEAGAGSAPSCGGARQRCCAGGDPCGGEALVCSAGFCMECGFEFERCCTGTSECHQPGLRCNITNDPPPAFSSCQKQGGGPMGGSG